jgi:hypothetical protein
MLELRELVKRYGDVVALYERTILRLGSPLTLAQALSLARSANG